MAELFDIVNVTERFKKAKANKILWEDHLRECYKYSMPEKNTIDTFSAGERKRNGLYDDTAMESLERFAARAHAQITPSLTKWAEFKAGSEIPDEEKEEADNMLDESTRVLFENIDNSNFDTQVRESYQDVGVSTGCLLVEEGDGVESNLNFRSISLSEIIPEKTSKMRIENVWREIEVAVRDIKSLYPKATITPKIAREFDNDEAAEVKLVEGVIKDEKTGKYIFMVFHVEYQETLLEEETDTSPFIVFREGSISGETLGRGRIMQKLPSIRLLNKVVEFHLKAAAKAISGTYTALNDGIINPDAITFGAGEIITVGSNDQANPTLRALERSGDPQLADIIIKDLRYGIKNFMLSEPFGQIDETPVRSATEMTMRDAESKEMRAGSFVRIESELLRPLVARCVDILKTNGKLPDFKVDGKEVKLKFTSPASRERDSDEVENIVKYAQVMQQTVPMPILQQTIKFEELPSGIAELMGVPSKYINTKTEIKKASQAQAQATQASNQLEAQKAGMEAEAIQGVTGE